MKNFCYNYYIIKKKRKNKEMTKNDILASKKARLAILESNNKNIKSQGVVKKLRRQIRNLER